MSDVSTVERRLSDLESRVHALESANPPNSRTGTPSSLKRPSPREFLLEKGPGPMIDKTLVAGYWWEVIEGREYFTLDDLAEFLRQAKESPPKNRRDAAYQNVKRGTFREEGARGQSSSAKNRWTLTNNGIMRVEEGFASRR
jgi:hypothetical protein